MLANDDPICKSVKELEAVKNELDELFSNHVFKIISEEEIPDGPAVRPSRMVYAIKNMGTEIEKLKA